MGRDPARRFLTDASGEASGEATGLATGDRLIELLEEARALGFVGPGDVVEHVRHAKAFLSALAGVPQGRSLDLGSGGGIPGLVLARARPRAPWVLLDASARRTSFLHRAVVTLDMASWVQVVTGRAEDVARRPEYRATFALVVARSFARPAVVAECAAPLLCAGGHLLVSEPPEEDGELRWPEDGLRALGLRLVTTTSAAPHVATLHQEQPCPERFPRRVGIPSKRPLW